MSGSVKQCRRDIGMVEVARFYVWSNGESPGKLYNQQDRMVKPRKMVKRRTPENGYRKMVAVLYDTTDYEVPDGKAYLAEAMELWTRKIGLANDETQRVVAETCLGVLRNLWDAQYVQAQLQREPIKEGAE